MNIQVKINDNLETIFHSSGDKFRKIYTSPNGYDVYREYKTKRGFLNAIKRVITNDSEIRSWNEDGTPNNNVKLF